ARSAGATGATRATAGPGPWATRGTAGDTARRTRPAAGSPGPAAHSPATAAAAERDLPQEFAVGRGQADDRPLRLVDDLLRPVDRQDRRRGVRRALTLPLPLGVAGLQVECHDPAAAPAAEVGDGQAVHDEWRRGRVEHREGRLEVLRE